MEGVIWKGSCKRCACAAQFHMLTWEFLTQSSVYPYQGTNDQEAALFLPSLLLQSRDLLVVFFEAKTKSSISVASNGVFYAAHRAQNSAKQWRRMQERQ